MNSATRIIAGYKAARTRKLNQLRNRAWGKLREISIAESGWVPTILPLAEGGEELSFDLGGGVVFRKFDNRTEALDYILNLFCC